MTAGKLLDELKKSGTAEEKLESIRAWAKRKKVRRADQADKLVAALELADCPLNLPGRTPYGDGQFAPYSPATVAKARAMLGLEVLREEPEPIEEEEADGQEQEEPEHEVVSHLTARLAAQAGAQSEATDTPGVYDAPDGLALASPGVHLTAGVPAQAGPRRRGG